MKKHTGKMIWALCQLCIIADTYLLWRAFSESIKMLGESVQVAPTTVGFSVLLCVIFGAGSLLIGCIPVKWCFSSGARIQLKAILLTSRDKTAAKSMKLFFTALLIGCLVIGIASRHSPYMLPFCMLSEAVIILWLLIYSSWMRCKEKP